MDGTRITHSPVSASSGEKDPHRSRNAAHRDSSRGGNPAKTPAMPFISFEGLDGSGKSTLIKNLKAHLEGAGLKVVVTREPGGTPLAEDIRGLILRTEHEAPVAATEILLYEASRAQHVAKVIQPALREGRWVLCDRFSESTVAFQCFARGVNRPEVEWLNRFAEQGTRPEAVVLLDLSVEASRLRQTGRQDQGGQSRDRIENEADEFHNRVRNGFLAQAKAEPERWIVLDAELSQDQLLQVLLAALKKRFAHEGFPG